MKKPEISYTSFARQLPIQIFQWDYSLVDEWKYKNFRIPQWRCWYTPEPGGFFTSNDTEYALDDKNILLIPPGMSLDMRNTQPFHQFYIHFTMSWEFQHREKKIFFIPVEKFSDSMLKELARPRWEWLPCDFLNVYSFLARAVALLPPGVLTPSYDLDGRIARLLVRLDQEKKFHYTNSELAKSINLSVNAFVKLFKEGMGVSPQFYLKRQRVNVACQMLHCTETSIDDIARITGFLDRYHFSRIFKQFTGQSPAKFRSKSYRPAPSHQRTSDPYPPKIPK